jgi:hypothetical protein
MATLDEFLQALTAPLNPGGAQVATLDLPGRTWVIPLGEGEWRLGEDGQIEVSLLNAANRFDDEDGVLGMTPAMPLGNVKIDDAFSPIKHPPPVPAVAGETWLKVRLNAEAGEAGNGSFDGVKVEAEATESGMVAIYQKIQAPGNAISSTLFFDVLDALAAQAETAFASMDTVVAFRVDAGMRGGVSIDFAQVAAAAFGAGVPALLEAGTGPLTMQLGPSAVLNADFSSDYAHLVVLRQSAQAGYVRVCVTLAEHARADGGVKLGCQATVRLDDDFIHALQKVLAAVNGVVEWNPAVIGALLKNESLSQVADAAEQGQVKEFLMGYVAANGATAGTDALFASAKSRVSAARDWIKGHAQARLEMAVSAQYALAVRKSFLLEADLPVGKIFAYLPGLLGGDLSAVQAAMRAGRVKNGQFLGQTVNMQESTLGFDWDFIMFDVATKFVVQDEQAEIEAWDGNGRTQALLALRRSWIGDNRVFSMVGETNFSVNNNVGFSAAQTRWGNDLSMGSFDDVRLKLSWRRVDAGDLRSAYAEAADWAAVLGVIPFARVVDVAAEWQNKAGGSGGGVVKMVQTEASLEARLTEDLLAEVQGLTLEDVAEACADAMPWNHYGDETPKIFKTDETYQKAMVAIWRYFLMVAQEGGTVYEGNLNQRLEEAVEDLKARNDPLWGPANDIYAYQRNPAVSIGPPSHGAPVRAPAPNESDGKFFSVIRACGNNAPYQQWQDWSRGLARLRQGRKDGTAPYAEVLEGTADERGVMGLLAGLSANSYLARVQAGLVRRTAGKMPGLSGLAPVVVVRSFDGTGAEAKMLEAQTVGKTTATS